MPAQPALHCCHVASWRPQLSCLLALHANLCVCVVLSLGPCMALHLVARECASARIPPQNSAHDSYVPSQQRSLAMHAIEGDCTFIGGVLPVHSPQDCLGKASMRHTYDAHEVCDLLLRLHPEGGDPLRQQPQVRRKQRRRAPVALERHCNGQRDSPPLCVLAADVLPNAMPC